MEKKRVLVTGAAGFIGYHTAVALQRRGDEVIGYDNFNDYYDPELKRARAAELAKNSVDVLRGDLCDTDLKDLVSTEKITHIIHLAAQAGVRYSLENPNAYVHSNLQGFLNVLEICRSYPEIRLTYASSSSVYGLNTKIPFSVEDRCDTQASLYGVTKRSNELMARSYHHLYGLHLTGLRFFTVYGPWGRPDMAYYSFARKISEGKPIQLFNQGDMRRDFTYIDDIVEGTLAAMDHCDGFQLYNLGNHQPVSLATFVETLEQALGAEAKKELLPMQPGDVKETYADIRLTQENLDWTPATSLAHGIPRFVEWFQGYHHSLSSNS